tara:strand:+ start:491 stop:766 length:276 start_codon:yes stop_codon:yes gene_type:complete
MKAAFKGKGLTTIKDTTQDEDEWTFSIKMTLDEVKRVMDRVVDCHVMEQTVEKRENYTGIRGGGRVVYPPKIEYTPEQWAEIERLMDLCED